MSRESTAEPLRHRQTKGAATDMLNLKPPRHTPTLRKAAIDHRQTNVASREISPTEREPFPSRYSIAAIVLRAIRARAATSFLTSIDSAVNSPCFRAFLLPLGAPREAPCIRQTLCPRTAGARHCRPLRFDLARHLDT